MEFEVNGYFDMGSNKNQKFKKVIEAENEETAREKIYSILGSKHRAKRRQIQIKEIKKQN
ncbi:50S ribosomal protein L18Ae [Methanonatronarchaeum sp. AMET-Sl]|uniref:50S ribosomal protein L18Ae n=1 Tax=Methanonatronarchaeum sp. AMET-Sl TaxID=3037654 RepID=UPI00244DAC7E|nr:50S ribosomal protein L18Ae [Methanonatronarchaeum sp. AMET-Sl]WGI16766.1 50S ribosomal protein L18Ae [Methanonatronarchaeum sp. AMET-Sl]